MRCRLVRPLGPAVAEQQVLLGDGVDGGAVARVVQQFLAVLRHDQEARLERARVRGERLDEGDHLLARPPGFSFSNSW